VTDDLKFWLPPMLTLLGPHSARRHCDGLSRRDFVRIGALGLGGAPSGDAVGLLDERDAHAHRLCGPRHRDEIPRLHPTACTVAEDERRLRLGCALDVCLRRAERRLDLERSQRNASSPPRRNLITGSISAARSAGSFGPPPRSAKTLNAAVRAGLAAPKTRVLSSAVTDRTALAIAKDWSIGVAAA